MVEKNIYLFIGEDSVSKDRKIASLKKEILAENSQSFDYELLFADSLQPLALKERLDSLPVISAKKIMVVKEADKLTAANKRILLAFAKAPNKKLVLILDTDKSQASDAFFTEVARFSRVFNFASSRPLSVFDLGRAIAAKRSKEALLCLSRLLKKGEKQSNILGVIGWQWKKLRREMKEEEFIRGLELLQEADYSIKRSRFKAGLSTLSLELLIVKLCAPTAG